MTQKPAHIESPEVIRELRKRFEAFDQACRGALSGCVADFNGTLEWLRNEQRTNLKIQLRKCEEALAAARGEYEQARWASSRENRSGVVEAMRALEKAKRRKEEVERKIEATKKWTVVMEQTAVKMLGPCNALTILLDQRTPQVLARLDRMLDNLDEYFRPGGGKAP